MFAAKLILAVVVACAVLVHAQDQAAAGAAPNEEALGFVQAIKDLGQTLTPEQKEQAKAIATNPSSTKQQVFDGLNSFFQGIGGEAETKFTALLTEFKSKIAQIGEKVKEREGSMSEEGKQLLAKAGEIHKNMGITFADEHQQIKALFESASPELKAKVQEIFGKLKAHKTAQF